MKNVKISVIIWLFIGYIGCVFSIGMFYIPLIIFLPLAVTSLERLKNPEQEELEYKKPEGPLNENPGRLLAPRSTAQVLLVSSLTGIVLTLVLGAWQLILYIPVAIISIVYLCVKSHPALWSCWAAWVLGYTFLRLYIGIGIKEIFHYRNYIYFNFFDLFFAWSSIITLSILIYATIKVYCKK